MTLAIAFTLTLYFQSINLHVAQIEPPQAAALLEQQDIAVEDDMIVEPLDTSDPALLPPQLAQADDSVELTGHLQAPEQAIEPAISQDLPQLDPAESLQPQQPVSLDQAQDADSLDTQPVDSAAPLIDSPTLESQPFMDLEIVRESVE